MTALKFAVTSGSLSEEIRAAASIAQQNGFAGLVVPSRTPAADLTELGETGAREYRHILSSFGQRLVAIDCSLGKDGFSPRADIDRVLARLQKVIAAAAELGRPMICLDLGPLPPAIEPPPVRPTITAEQAGGILVPDFPPPQMQAATQRAEKRDTAFESSADSALQALGQYADRHGTMLALRSSLAGFASLERSITGINCPWFGVDLDPVAMLADEWDADTTFSRLGSHIRHVRGRDAVRGSGNRTQPAEMGSGSVDWKVLLANLDGAGYGGFLTIDSVALPNRAAAAVNGLATIQAMIRRPS